MAKSLKVRNSDNTEWVPIASVVPQVPDISTFATIEYVDNEIANIDLSSASAAAVTYLVDGAPNALNTLNELAAALNDDESFATTITNSIASKLDISTASATYQEMIPYSSSAPSSPSTGDLWVDSSTTPPALKTYNGSSWVQLGSAVDDAQVVFSGRMFA